MVDSLRQLLTRLAEKGTLLAPEALDRLAEVPEDQAARVLLADTHELPFILTPQDLERLLASLPAPVAPDAPVAPASPRAAPEDEAEAAPGGGSAPSGDEGEAFPSHAELWQRVRDKPVPARPRLIDAPYAHDTRVIADITGNSTCEGAISDFTKYFNDRLGKLAKILRQRRELVGRVPIKSIRPGGSAEVKLIGVVTEVRSTKNGHKIIELEDETGSVPILALANSDHVFSDAESVIEDEVIGAICKPPRAGSNLLLLERLVRPDLPTQQSGRRSEQGSAVAIISDIHFGANTFLHEDWDRFIRWINGEYGNARMKQLARKTKYLIVNGDIVDGIGIFPGQEDELIIPDAPGQYEYAAHEFARIRDDVQIIMLPGNHDMVRPAEPQPALPEKYRKLFDKDIVQVGNPVKISIEGVEFLSYHGFSMVDWNTRIAGLSFEEPTNTMREMLQRRHVCPMYGLRTPIAPEHKDYLVIDTVPDVFITGHIHAFGMENYRGVTMVNASCWQSQTAYQKMHGFVPEPSKAAVFELDNGRSHCLDFHRGAAGVDAVGKSKFGPTDPKVKPEF